MSLQSSPSASDAPQLPVDRASSTVNEITESDSSDRQSTVDVNLKREKRRVWKNVTVISVAFLFNFNAFLILSRLQSTLNRVEGMGVITMSILYATFVVSCLFAPKLMIRFFGHRWTIVVSFFGYIFYMAANGYAVWGTMIPSSVLVGLCAAPLWTAQASYFTIIAQHYKRLTGQTSGTVISRFFGLFFFCFRVSSITGSIISATVLRGNASVSAEDVDVTSCGAVYCPWTNSTNSNLNRPPDSTVWTMIGIYLAIACLAVVVVAVFVDNLPSDLVDTKNNVRSEIGRNLVATFVHLRHPKQLLIIPLSMYVGIAGVALNAEFSQAFVSCTLGIWKIGLVSLPFDVANACTSLASGHILKYTRRIPIFLLGMCVDLSIQVTMMIWRPSTSQEYVLYILAAIWGVSSGIWHTQINTLYGMLFPSESEAAFSNYHLWKSLGQVIAFGYSFYLCAAVKLYILTSTLVVGMLCYLAAEYLHRKTRGSSADGGVIGNVVISCSTRETMCDNSSVDLNAFKEIGSNETNSNVDTAYNRDQVRRQDNTCFSESREESSVL